MLRHMRTYPAHTLFLFILLTVVGCAQLGLTTAKNFDERLAYAVAAHTAVQRSTAQSLEGHTITSQDAKAVLKMADDTRPLLDAALLARQIGNMDDANAKLLLAQTSLTALQAYLNSRSHK